ncbi:PfkB family carbohydrate kinase, partial [Staphylococcus aureus]|nr:PfkB family carbohydrate kinase [Staphylococcus aureus]
KLVVDAEKELAESFLPYNPLFIKHNKDELELMFNTTVNSDTDVIKYCRLLVYKGAQSVIVSLVGEGAIYIDKEISIKAF